MNIIASADKNWGIGYKNELLYKIPDDLKYFKQKTINKVVVVGENTFFSLPDAKPLKNRTHIVLSQNKNIKFENVIIADSLQQAFKLIKNYSAEDVFIIGGTYVYEQFLPYCEYAYITKILNCKKADRFFVNLDNLHNWQLTEESETQTYQNIKFKFCIYKNNNPTKIK